MYGNLPIYIYPQTYPNVGKFDHTLSIWVCHVMLNILWTNSTNPFLQGFYQPIQPFKGFNLPIQPIGGLYQPMTPLATARLLNMASPSRNSSKMLSPKHQPGTPRVLETLDVAKKTWQFEDHRYLFPTSHICCDVRCLGSFFRDAGRFPRHNRNRYCNNTFT